MVELSLLHGRNENGICTSIVKVKLTSLKYSREIEFIPVYNLIY